MVLKSSEACQGNVLPVYNLPLIRKLFRQSMTYEILRARDFDRFLMRDCHLLENSHL